MPKEQNQVIEMQDFRTPYLKQMAEKLADREIAAIQKGNSSRLQTMRISTTNIQLPDRAELTEKIMASADFRRYTANMESEELSKLADKSVDELGSWWDGEKAQEEKKREQEAAEKAAKEKVKPAAPQTPEEQKILGKLNGRLNKFVLMANEKDPVRKEALLAMITKLVAMEDKQRSAEGYRPVTSRDDFLEDYVNAHWLVSTVNGMSTDEIAALSHRTPQELNAWSKDSIEAVKKNISAGKTASADPLEKLFGKGAAQAAAGKKTVDANGYFSALEEAVLGYHGTVVEVSTLQQTVSDLLWAHHMMGKDKTTSPQPMEPEKLSGVLQRSVEESRKVLDVWSKAEDITSTRGMAHGFANDVEMALDVHMIARMAQKGIDPNSPEGSRMLLASKIALGAGRSFTDKQDFLCHPEKFMNTVELISRSPSFRSFINGKSPAEIQKMAKRGPDSLYEDFLDEMAVTRQKKQGVPEAEAREAVKAAKGPNRRLTAAEQIQKDIGLPMEQAEAIVNDLKKELNKGVSLDDAQKTVGKKYPDYGKAVQAKDAQFKKAMENVMKQVSADKKQMQELSLGSGLPPEKLKELAKEVKQQVNLGHDPATVKANVYKKHPEIKKLIKEQAKQQELANKQQQVKDAYKKKQNLTLDQPSKKPVAAK